MSELEELKLAYAECSRQRNELLNKLKSQAQQQEPVAYGMWDTMLGKGNRMMMVRLDKGQDGCTVPLYTSPPAQRTWVGLTDAQSTVIWANSKSVDEAIRATEERLKENNK